MSDFWKLFGNVFRLFSIEWVSEMEANFEKLVRNFQAEKKLRNITQVTENINKIWKNLFQHEAQWCWLVLVNMLIISNWTKSNFLNRKKYLFNFKENFFSNLSVLTVEFFSIFSSRLSNCLTTIFLSEKCYENKEKKWS